MKHAQFLILKVTDLKKTVINYIYLGIRTQIKKKDNSLNCFQIVTRKFIISFIFYNLLEIPYLMKPLKKNKKTHILQYKNFKLLTKITLEFIHFCMK